jgi:hypothetical protein
MPRMNYYTQEEPPKHGSARKIWQALTRAGFSIHELHYNPNLWGQGKELGWGTWAFQADSVPQGFPFEFINIGAYAGIIDKRVYVQSLSAPFAMLFLDELKEE